VLWLSSWFEQLFIQTSVLNQMTKLIHYSLYGGKDIVNRLNRLELKI